MYDSPQSIRLIGNSSNPHVRITTSKQDGSLDVKSSDKYIRKDALDDAGIIFVASSDPISRLIISITKQEFSTIGFYYVTTISRKPVVHVVLVDLFASNITPDSPTRTIDDLLSNPLVTSVAIKRLQPVTREDGTVDFSKTKQLQANFRSAIANVMSNHNSRESKATMTERIFQLFGYQSSDKEPTLTGISMVNQVIQKIGRSNLLLPSDTVSLRTLAELETFPTEPSHLIGYLGSALNQQPDKQQPDENGWAKSQIQSYIVPNSLFGDLYYLRLGTSSRAESPDTRYSTDVVDKAMLEALKNQQPYLSQAITTFTDLLFTNHKFFETVLQGVREGKLRDESLQHTLLEALHECSQNRVTDIRWVVRSLMKGELDGRALQELIQEVKEDHDDILLFSEREPTEEDLTPNLSLDKDFRVWVRSGNHSNRIQEEHNELQANVRQLHRLVADLTASAKNNQQAQLDINALIDCANNLVKIGDVSLGNIVPLPQETSYSIVGTSSSRLSEELSIRLRRGGEIILPLRGADLSFFERDELLEMLELLDSGLDSFESMDAKSYDDLREKITKELSTR